MACIVGVQGSRNHSAGVHAVLDPVLPCQHCLGAVPGLSAALVRRRGRRHAGRLVGLHLVDGQPDRLHAVQRGFPRGVLPHPDVPAAQRQRPPGGVHPAAARGARSGRHGARPHQPPAASAAADAQIAPPKSTESQRQLRRPRLICLAPDSRAGPGFGEGRDECRLLAGNSEIGRSSPTSLF